MYQIVFQKMSHNFLVTDDAKKNVKIDPLREKICGFITIIMTLTT